MAENQLKKTTISLNEVTLDKLYSLMEYTGFNTKSAYLTYIINSEYDRKELNTKFYKYNKKTEYNCIQ